MTEDAGAQTPQRSESRFVGLALSGGGHRATMFALGALLYLVDSGQNAAVGTITSVSGGSLLNAYLGSLDTPFHNTTSENFERDVSRIASSIAGRPKRWNLGAYLTSIAIILWTIGRLVDSICVQGLAVIVAVVASICGSNSGGSLWCWPGTWLYTNAIAIALIEAAIGVYAVAVERNRVGFAWIFPFILLRLLLSNRCGIASIAIGKAIQKFANQKGITLEGLNSEMQHIFCATEMHGGQHFYFGRDFVYSPGIGVGRPGRLPLRAAVQTSANYLGAFPFRKLRTSRFRFRVWDLKEIAGGPEPGRSYHESVTIGGIPKSVSLTDGGVFDNLGVSWFLHGKHFAEGISRWLDHMSSFYSINKNRNVEYENEILPAMRSATHLCYIMMNPPPIIIVINSGKPVKWQSTPGNVLPFISEFTSLLSVTGVMYNNTQTGRIDDLQRRFLDGSLKGAVVDLAEGLNRNYGITKIR
jgi:hypothetical protein